jgi:hypothetical protein
VAAPPEPAGTVNRSRWLPIAGLGLALLMVTLDILSTWRSSTSGNAATAASACSPQ